MTDIKEPPVPELIKALAKLADNIVKYQGKKS